MNLLDEVGEARRTRSVPQPAISPFRDLLLWSALPEKISTESCDVIASDGEPVIDLRGKTARTSLPFSAGGMATLAKAGAGRGIGFGVGVAFGGGVALGSAESPGVLGVEATAGGGEAGSSASGLADGLELSAAEPIESSRSSH